MLQSFLKEICSLCKRRARAKVSGTSVPTSNDLYRSRVSTGHYQMSSIHFPDHNHPHLQPEKYVFDAILLLLNHEYIVTCTEQIQSPQAYQLPSTSESPLAVPFWSHFNVNLLHGSIGSVTGIGSNPTFTPTRHITRPEGTAKRVVRFATYIPLALSRDAMNRLTFLVLPSFSSSNGLSRSSCVGLKPPRCWMYLLRALW
jgi:hypothetical protein